MPIYQVLYYSIVFICVLKMSESDIPPTEESLDLMSERWQRVLRDLGMNPTSEDEVSQRSYEAAIALVDITRHLRDQWSEAEAESIRDFFKMKAVSLH